mmetsp:Transcript_47408/g.90522  ORF Transcript_47408/g.90522 Transcript_47408/m.90522 type:complete len:120 (-) Transcript_47408:102-461(-)|eukprot:CAMPEP_0114245038 /NCGR_PEP_ID=MMETSP0058-20121206/11669_1 /TAXON_ID=36894 /ORGANISM="Pyramimonas parkeae, CCMP726" /LENGTH=119 /DNA_ID=CAMNT_0001358037 /DNA_START=107 /DNA_END=466 /DNA_ORIENTATION=+
MAAITASCIAPVTRVNATTARPARATRMMGMKATPQGLPALFGKATVDEQFASMARSTRTVSARRATALQSTASMEVMELANMASEISTVATTCFGITLVGLAIGFVLLRVEAIVEESD